MTMDRRTFLRASGVGAGALAATGWAGVAERVTVGLRQDAPLSAVPAKASVAGTHVVVVGAGAFGGWAALHLQEMGAEVTLVDLYGPGNSRSSSGDETRGIRTSYPGREIWTSWAQRSIERWKAFDADYAARMGGRVFFTTGDLIFRDTEVGFVEQVREIWDWARIPYEVLTMDDVAHRWPQFRTDGMTVALYEPGAGVARARTATQRVAHLVEERGGRIVTGRATPGTSIAGRLQDVEIAGPAGGERLAADHFVFALGPWFASTFLDVLGDLFRVPMGNVVYFGTPPGDLRFDYPNIPSWNFQGVTGWPSLPPDHRGFRVRASGQAGGNDPDVSNRWVPEEGLVRPRQMLEERFPALASQPIMETRACHYETPATRDWIVDLHPGYGNVWFAGGGSAEGFKFGPTVGELIAARVLGDDRFGELDAEFRLPPPEPSETT
jgi:glycine/D-amino acid oxidase-like deaminating enzyme